MFKQLLRRKPMPSGADNLGGASLQRNINLLQLTLMGVTSTLGTGIFFVLAETVPTAGPSVIMGFLIAAFTAGLSAVCYAEVSSQLPVSGSAYTYSYVTLGEGAAVVVVAGLLLEWGVSGAAIAVGWSQYFEDLLHIAFGVDIPDVIQFSPFSLDSAGDWRWNQRSYVNAPAVVLVWMCAAILLRGSAESARINMILTGIKLIILTIFVVLTLTAFNADNFEPFMPAGLAGVTMSASVVFYSFIGLDAIANASEEAMDPQRNIPRALVGALLVVACFYIAVAVTSLGVQPAPDFVGQAGSLAAILQRATGQAWLGGLLAAGAVVSIFSVTMVCMFGQSRIFLALARDGLLPKSMGEINPESHSPSRAIVMIAILLTPLAGFAPADLLFSMVSFGTLLTFIAVALSLMVLRSRFKRQHLGYKTPAYPFVPLLSIASCMYLMSGMSASALWAFAVWLGAVLVFYSYFGRKHALT